MNKNDINKFLLVLFCVFIVMCSGVLGGIYCLLILGRPVLMLFVFLFYFAVIALLIYMYIKEIPVPVIKIKDLLK